MRGVMGWVYPLVFAAGVVGIAGAVKGQEGPKCNEAGKVRAALEESGQYRMLLLDSKDGKPLEIWAMPDGGPWSAHMIVGPGMMCLLDYGDMWIPGYGQKLDGSGA